MIRLFNVFIKAKKIYAIKIRQLSCGRNSFPGGMPYFVVTPEYKRVNSFPGGMPYFAVTPEQIKRVSSFRDF